MKSAGVYFVAVMVVTASSYLEVRSERTDCGFSVVSPSFTTATGNKTVAGKWPWMVSISVPRNNNVTLMICGGALLDRKTVVTSALCLMHDFPYYVLHFGKYHRKTEENGVEMRRAHRIIIHPQFNNTTYENDIALIKLETSLQYTEKIRPICLPTPSSSETNLVLQNMGIVTGWGLNREYLLPEVLMMIKLPVQTRSTCESSFRRLLDTFRMKPGMFCVGYPEYSVSVCRGDTGSPYVFYNQKTNRYTIEGIVSFGLRGRCDRPGAYTVFTKVSHYLDWIGENMEEQA